MENFNKVFIHKGNEDHYLSGCVDNVKIMENPVLKVWETVLVKEEKILFVSPIAKTLLKHNFDKFFRMLDPLKIL